MNDNNDNNNKRKMSVEEKQQDDLNQRQRNMNMRRQGRRNVAAIGRAEADDDPGRITPMEQAFKRIKVRSDTPVNEVADALAKLVLNRMNSAIYASQTESESSGTDNIEQAIPTTRQRYSKYKDEIINAIQNTTDLNIYHRKLTPDLKERLVFEIYNNLNTNDYYSKREKDDANAQKYFGNDFNQNELNQAANNISELIYEDDKDVEGEREEGLFTSFYQKIQNTFNFFYDRFINKKLQDESVRYIGEQDYSDSQQQGLHGLEMIVENTGSYSGSKDDNDSDIEGACSVNSTGSSVRAEILNNFADSSTQKPAKELGTIQEGEEGEEGEEEADSTGIDVVEGADSPGIGVGEGAPQPKSSKAKSTTTTDLSKIFKDFFKGGLILNTKNLYQEMAKELYHKNTTIDVRRSAEHEKTAEKQMKQVWGVNLTAKAKTPNYHCYLCGGNIVVKNTADEKVSPEMEHKLPCTYFYAKFPSIFRVFDEVLIKWISWVDEDGNVERENAIHILYYLMNPIENNTFNDEEVNKQFNTIFKDFKADTEVRALANDPEFTDKVVAYLQKKNTNNSSTEFDNVQFNEYLQDFGVVLKGYLMEFAYSHHYCNQIKSNYFLKKPSGSSTSNVDNYYNYLYHAVSSDQYRLSDGYNIKPAMPNQTKFSLERDAIAKGLGITLTGGETEEQKNNKETIKLLRINNTSQEMETLEQLATESAIKVSNTTSKRAVLRSVRDLVRNAKTQNTLSASDGKKISRKEQKNMKKAFKKFSILFKLDKTDTEANVVSFAFNLNKLVENLNTSLTTPPTSDRVRNQKKEVFSTLNSQFQQLLTEINDFICDNDNFDPLYNIYQQLRAIDNISIEAEKSAVCNGLNDLKKYLNNINNNLNTIKVQLNAQTETTDSTDSSLHEIISSTNINNKIDQAITGFECSEKNPPPIDTNIENKKDSAGDPKGGSRRRIKKRRPSRTRRNKSNLKSKSKTKTRKQKRQKLKRKSKKRKGSSHRRSRR